MSLKTHILAVCLLAAGAALVRPAAAQEELASVSARAEHPLAAEILGAAAPLPRLAEVYQERGGAPLWSAADGPLSAPALLEALEEAEAHALPAARYGLAHLRARVEEARSLDPTRRAALEVDLTRALTRYAGDLAAGLLVPQEVDGEIHVFPERPEPEEIVAEALAAPDLGRWLARQAPQDAGYDKLREVYARLGREVRAGGWRATLSEGGALRPGDSGERVAQLRARLAELGDPAQATERPELYDDALEEAVRDFQERHGLNTDGIVGPKTFAALGANAGWRLRQAAVNLERMRWAQSEDLGPLRIEVNLADFRMRLYRDGEVALESRVVAGQRRHRTPEFSDTMDHLVVNPTWHVPRSIATQEILPMLKEDPEYLARENMRLVAADGGPVPDRPAEHDWSQYDRGFFPYRIKQRPGSANALGRVKFMFPNRFSIYLHDTPAKRLFQRDARAFSHGCVRVEKPYELAHMLLEPQLEDPERTFARWLAAGSERYVTLERPIPVRITYRTAWVDEQGRAQFRDDIYGRDAEVWAALEGEGLSAGL